MREVRFLSYELGVGVVLHFYVSCDTIELWTTVFSVASHNKGGHLHEYSKATIIYKNVNDKLMEVGSVTVHVVDRDPEDYTPYSLEFGFGDETADRFRYKNACPYDEINYDSTLRWRFKEYTPLSQGYRGHPGRSQPG